VTRSIYVRSNAVALFRQSPTALSEIVDALARVAARDSSPGIRRQGQPRATIYIRTADLMDCHSEMFTRKSWYAERKQLMKTFPRRDFVGTLNPICWLL
jgi:hypothetical protein